MTRELDVQAQHKAAQGLVAASLAAVLAATPVTAKQRASTPQSDVASPVAGAATPQQDMDATTNAFVVSQAHLSFSHSMSLSLSQRLSVLALS